MKKLLFIIALLFATSFNANGQTDNSRFSYTTYFGTGIPMSKPSHTPFSWQVMSHYHINRRFAIGAGSGLSVYEKTLIPLYASVQFFLTRPKKFTPYLECNIGGVFAPAKEANGGLYLSPAFGGHLRITSKLKMNFAVGYELQKLNRLKKHTDDYFYTEFKEELSHSSFTFKIGVTY